MERAIFGAPGFLPCVARGRTLPPRGVKALRRRMVPFMLLLHLILLALVRALVGAPDHRPRVAMGALGGTVEKQGHEAIEAMKPVLRRLRLLTAARL
eukprot:3857315-Alexandrium_andersonii.AAC.1